MNIPNNEIADKVFSPSGHDPQDRAYWYQEGMMGEKLFIEQVAPRIGLNAQINPAKDNEPWAPDLLIYFNGCGVSWN